MYAVFAIVHLRTTSERAMDWNGYNVSGRWLHEECEIDQGRELFFVHFALFDVINLTYIDFLKWYFQLYRECNEVLGHLHDFC